MYSMLKFLEYILKKQPINNFLINRQIRKNVSKNEQYHYLIIPFLNFLVKKNKSENNTKVFDTIKKRMHKLAFRIGSQFVIFAFV